MKQLNQLNSKSIGIRNRLSQADIQQQNLYRQVVIGQLADMETENEHHVTIVYN